MLHILCVCQPASRAVGCGLCLRRPLSTSPAVPCCVQVPLIASNRIGKETFEQSHITFYGGSFIAGPAGEIVAQARDLEGGWNALQPGMQQACGVWATKALLEAQPDTGLA